MLPQAFDGVKHLEVISNIDLKKKIDHVKHMKIINNKDVTKSFWRCEKRSTILKLQKVLESVKHEKIINNINVTKGIWECETFGKNKQYYCYQMCLRVGGFGKK